MHLSYDLGIEDDGLDVCVYDPIKYAGLLLKGNPKVVEPLFSDKTFLYSPEMSVLLQHRATFLNQVTAMQYIGYAHNKLHAFAKEHINKDLYHALRLASEADRIVNKKFPMVFMEGPLREELMAIRIGEVNTSEVVARISALLCNAEAKVSSLPQKIDENILNVWLLSIYGISPQVQALQQEAHPLALHARSLLQEHGFNGEIIYCGVSGSIAQHLNTPTSTPDYIAVFSQPLQSLISLNPAPNVIGGTLGTSTQANTSFTFLSGWVLIEARCAVGHLLGGSPRLLELLFTEFPEDFISPRWSLLQKMREQFISSAAVMQCLNVASAQASVAEKCQCNRNKIVMHSMRLLLQAELLHQNKPPVVTAADDISKLMAIRSLPPDSPLLGDFISEIKKRTAALRNACKNNKQNKLEKQEIKNVVDTWLASLRLGE